MALEDQVQPVVTVAAFDPLQDTIQLSVNDENQYSLPTVAVKNWPGIVDERIMAEINKEYDFHADHLRPFDTKIRDNILHDYRVAAILGNIGKVKVSIHNFHTLDYVPEVREFLARLFEEYKRTGTLLSTLKQPVYVRPSFLDLQGNQALIPMDKHTAGMPRTYLREEHRHLDEVIGDIVHDYINTRKVVVEGVRMAATSKKLVHGKTEVPTWIMDYGIVIDTDQANKLVETEKVERVNVREGLQFTLALPPTKPYSAKVKVVLEEMRDIIAASIITAKEPRSINFPEARKKSLTFR